MLHIVNKSPTMSPALASCLRLAQPGHALLLIEDAVYAATAAAGLAEQMKHLRVYALQGDVQARGMQGRLAANVTEVDYGGFVGLVAEHRNNQSWL